MGAIRRQAQPAGALHRSFGDGSAEGRGPVGGGEPSRLRGRGGTSVVATHGGPRSDMADAVHARRPAGRGGGRGDVRA
eukprot:4989425-Pleurochrysis_carterae.AAC.1